MQRTKRGRQAVLPRCVLFPRQVLSIGQLDIRQVIGALSAPRRGHRPRPRRRNASWNSRPSGAGSTRRSPGCGRTRGASSSRSWTTTSKSGGSSAAPTPSNPSRPPLPARRQGQRPFPHRAGGPEMPLPGHPGTGPHRQRQGTMGLTVEAGPECHRHQLRRKNQLYANRGSTVKRTLPRLRESPRRCLDRH
jgi:hypothetical protein